MKIKITCTVKEYQAGLVYDVPDEEAKELIAAEKAIELKEPMYFEDRPKRKVKHGDG